MACDQPTAPRQMARPNQELRYARRLPDARAVERHRPGPFGARATGRLRSANVQRRVPGPPSDADGQPAEDALALFANPHTAISPHCAYTDFCPRPTPPTAPFRDRTGVATGTPLRVVCSPSLLANSAARHQRGSSCY